jgi:hypothetical protein
LNSSLLQFKSPYRDGINHIIMSPLQFSFGTDLTQRSANTQEHPDLLAQPKLA